MEFNEIPLVYRVSHRKWKELFKFSNKTLIFFKISELYMVMMAKWASDDGEIRQDLAGGPCAKYIIHSTYPKRPK